MNRNNINQRLPTQEKEVINGQQGQGTNIQPLGNGSRMNTVGSRVHTVGSRVNTVGNMKEQNKQKDQKKEYTYSIQGDNIVGNGTFGVVYFATINETGEAVAIKKVFQDKRYKNRELTIMKEIKNHPNVIGLKSYFYTYSDENQDDVYLNIVMDYVPETLYRMIRYFAKKSKGNFPNILLKSLAYIEGLGICHRDIKPHNVLVDPRTHSLKMCDFGSAKKLIPTESNISYICSRCYRAPELMFMATNYTNAIDTWSVGCVIAEMILGDPIFIGESSVDQLIEIIKVLGTPTAQQIIDMNPDHQQSEMPKIKAVPWVKVFKHCRVDPLAIDLLSKILVYSPQKRLKPLEVLAHPFFDELRNPKCRINGNKLPELFNFTQVEAGSYSDELLNKLIPDWYSQMCAGVDNVEYEDFDDY